MARSEPELNGKIAVITGGSSLIGQAIIDRLVDSGASVVIANNDDVAGERLAAAHGDAVRVVSADVRNDDDLDELVDTAVREFGGLDIVVSGAAIFDCDLLETTREHWHRSLDINVVGAAVLMGKATPHLIARGGGSMVIISSISAKQSQPGRIVYPVTKTALQGLAPLLLANLPSDFDGAMQYDPMAQQEVTTYLLDQAGLKKAARDWT